MIDLGMILNLDLQIPTSNPYIFYPAAFIISFSGVLIPGPMTAVSVAKGLKDRAAGIKIATGHGLIEVPLILLIYFGFARFFQDPDSLLNSVIAFFGGAMLMYMGGTMFKIRKSILEKSQDMPIGSIGAGVITSGGNPSFFIWWATVGILLIINAAIFGPLGLIAFIIIHISADFLWYGLLSFGTYRSKHLMSKRFHEALFGVLSIFLIFLGTWFVLSIFT
jgi:threonine/homoserine/homoserine lactone efflux protein